MVEPKYIKYLDLKSLNDSFEPALSQAVQRVLDSGWYLLGAENIAFEQEFSAYCRVKHAVAVANGLDALTLVLTAWQELGLLQPGDEVIVPANTFIATILAIRKSNLVPVLAEPDPATFNLSPFGLEALLTAKTKVVLPVHLYGQCADMDAITAFAERHGLLVLEDAAQAHGATWKGRRTGNLGHAAGFSFYPGKNLGCLGDGGCVTTNDDALAECVRQLANYGTSAKYVNRYAGVNSRLDELQAAVLRVKLARLDEDNDKRRALARRYLSQIDHPDVVLPNVADFDAHVFHIFPILSPRRDELAAHLAAAGIETVVHYPIPPHRQEAFKEWNQLRFPVTERIHEQELSLPLSPILSEAEQDRICACIHQMPRS